MRRLVPIALVAAVAACSDGSPEGSRSPLAAQGERVYQNVCIACHHGDPNQDGSLGPAVAGASAELLEFRLVRGGYPPGYTPKRPGETMPRFEYLADQIPALAAYLAEARREDRSGQVSGRPSHDYSSTTISRYSAIVRPRPAWIVPDTVASGFWVGLPEPDRQFTSTASMSASARIQ
jgi:hypothetical protein